MSADLKTALKNGNDYYIHLNKINIGNRGGNATINFIEQKQQIILKTTAQYKEYFNANLNGQSIEALSAALDLDQNTFLNILNNKIGEKLQKDINVAALSKLYQGVKNGNISSFLKQAVNNSSVQALSSALKIVAEALKLLEEQNTGSLGAILLHSLENNKANSFADLGNKLRALLNQYEINNNYRLIKRQSLESAKKQLNNLAQALISGKFVSTKNDLTAQGLSTLLLNGIISTSIAQGLAFAMSGKAGSILYKSILQSVGTKAVVTSDSGKDIKITGKTDVKAKHVNISLGTTDNGNGGNINLNIGISSKFYTGQGFKDLNNRNISINSGSGGTLKQALNSIFSDDISRYLVYNYITHGEYTTQINDLIIKRQILRLFATVGSKEDFSQFMLINGHIISIWEIMQYVLNNDLGLSKSMNGSNFQGIVISIPDRKNFMEANKYDQLDSPGETPIVAAWNRSHKVNSAIESARIYAEIHFKNLAAAIYH